MLGVNVDFAGSNTESSRYFVGPRKTEDLRRRAF